MLTQLLALILMTTPAPQDTPPTGDSVAPEDPAAAAAMDRYSAARGTPEALAGGLPLRAAGRVEMAMIPDGLRIEEVHLGLGRGKLTTTSETMGTFEEAANGEFAWYVDSMTKTIREGPQAEELMRRWAVTFGADWRQLYARAVSVEPEVLGEREALRIELAARPLIAVDAASAGAEDAPETAAPVAPAVDVWYLDAETHLPLRTLTRGPGSGGAPGEVRIDWSDWRQHEGALYAHRSSVTIAGQSFTILYESFERGVELPADFLSPSDDVLAARAAAADPDARAREEAPHLEQVAERDFASIRVECTQDQLQVTLSTILPEAFTHVIGSGAEMTGVPCVVYHTWGEALDIEGGVPVAAPITPGERMRASKLPGGTCVVAWHVGPYERLGQTHSAIEAFLEAEGLERRAEPYEEYWTDPGVEPDPEHWRTRVVWPVQPKTP